MPQPDTLKSNEEAQRIYDLLLNLESSTQVRTVVYRGWSTCRLCGQGREALGNREYSLGGWTWPQGYKHYVREHRVKPPDSFLSFLKENK